MISISSLTVVINKPLRDIVRAHMASRCLIFVALPFIAPASRNTFGVSSLPLVSQGESELMVILSSRPQSILS